MESSLLLNFAATSRSSFKNILQKKIVHIPNKVEMPTTFANTFIPNDKGRFVVLCVGRLCKQKRQTLLLNAFEMVARKALDWDLLFVGEGGLEKQLKKEIAKKGLTERVSIAKNVTDLSKIYENAHIYCQPSEWEGFPNAVAEAMAHKLPSLGFFETAGFRELIQNTKGGILIREKTSAESLAIGSYYDQ